MNNVPPNCIPTFCQLGTHIFPLPNPIALAADNKHIAEALKSGDFKTAGCIQTRLHAQMQVFAALQHFRNDASFVVVPATNPQFDHLLDCFIEQQRQLDSSLSEKVRANNRIFGYDGKKFAIREELYTNEGRAFLQFLKILRLPRLKQPINFFLIFKN